MRRWPLSQRSRVADSLCSSGRRSGSGRGPKTLPPFRKVTNAGSSGRWSGPGRDLWWFPLGRFRFLEPLAPSNQQQHGSQRLRTRPQSSLSSLTSLRVRFREFHDGRGRGTAESCMVAEIEVYWRGNPTNSLGSGGVSRVFHIPGQPPTWCDLWRCREMITKLHFEGVWRDIPGPTPEPQLEEGCLRDIRAAAAPEFLHDGHQSQTGHWTAFLCPV